MTKKTVFPFLLMVAGIAGLGFIAPWWAAPIWIVLIVVLFRLQEKESIPAGGCALGLVWLVMARLMSIHDDAGIISKTGILLGGLSHSMMMVVTLLIAMITGIFSGWFGSALSKVAFSKKS